jgi:4-hydroxybenzoyl-CoA reductase subunit beta
MRYSLPRSIDEALAIAGAEPDHAYVAGGTDMMVQRAQGVRREQVLIDLSRIEELRCVELGDSSVAIGAGVTLASLIAHEGLGERVPALVEAARSIASPAVRTSATVGGNLLCENRCVYYDQSEFWRNALGYCLKCDGDVCIATGGSKNCYSVYISDLAPVLLCLDARVEIVGADGPATIPLESLYTGDGIRPRALPAGALLTRVVIDCARERALTFAKLRPRASVDFTNLTLSVRRTHESTVAAATGVGPAPAIARAGAEIEAEALAVALLARTRIIDNLPYKRAYRREMLRTLMVAAYARLAGGNGHAA